MPVALHGQLSSARFGPAGPGARAARDVGAVVGGGRCGARRWRCASARGWGPSATPSRGDGAHAASVERLALEVAAGTARRRRCCSRGPPRRPPPSPPSRASAACASGPRPRRLGPRPELAAALPAACPALREAALLPPAPVPEPSRRARGGAGPAAAPAALLEADALLQVALARRRPAPPRPRIWN
eukprot:tig00000169_g11908.t1